MLYILRHAEDSPDIIGGWSDIGLTSIGQNQAKEATMFFKKFGQQLHLTKIIASSLQRSIQTITPIAKTLNIPITTDINWNGLNQGILNGLSSPEALQKYPFYSLDNIPSDMKFPCGESIQDFSKRVKTAFNEVLKSDKNILICTHGANMMVINSMMKGRRWDYKKHLGFYPCTLMIIDPINYQYNYESLSRRWYVVMDRY